MHSERHGVIKVTLLSTSNQKIPIQDSGVVSLVPRCTIEETHSALVLIVLAT